MVEAKEAKRKGAQGAFARGTDRPLEEVLRQRRRGVAKAGGPLRAFAASCPQTYQAMLRPSKPESRNAWGMTPSFAYL
jgi:hypothetical protein